MKNMFCKAALATLLLTILSGSAFAQRVATVDLNKAFNGYWKKKEAEATLKDQENDTIKELKGIQEEAKKLKDAYQSLLDSASDPAVSGDEKEKRKTQADDKLKQLKQKQDEFANFENRAKMESSERRKSVTMRILAEIKSVVSAKAKSANYALVIDASNESLVVYATGEYDITDAVLADLNATAPQSSSTPASDSKPKKK